MSSTAVSWDYLVVTASNDTQARAYESQLRLRERLGLLCGVRQILVVPDPQGKRVGSGGSTLGCLVDVVNRELAALAPSAVATSPAHHKIQNLLAGLRILIIHAGGDSRRLPAYGPCGKIFIPVPGEHHENLGCTLFDRIAPAFMSLPPGHQGRGQVVIAAGDALILFDPSNVTLEGPGLTALACPASPEAASKHGVFCVGRQQQVRLYLQKPGRPMQLECGAINASGQSLLDIGIMSFDSTMAMALFRAFGIELGPSGQLTWPDNTRHEVLTLGLDFYREICCAMGEAATADHHRHQAQASGSRWSADSLLGIYETLKGIPFNVQTVPQARFLHFGTTRQLITSGIELRQHDHEQTNPTAPLSLNSNLGPRGEIIGNQAWVEGCRLHATLQLDGGNVVIGVEVLEPLALPKHACLDILQGRSRDQRLVWFIRCYGLADTFKDNLAQGATFCGQPLLQWLADVGVQSEDVWDKSLPLGQRSLWDARVFPSVNQPDNYRQWLWMFAPTHASPAQKQAFIAADRYSAAEIAVLADPDSFYARRQQNLRSTTQGDPP
jgi:fucokinase